MYDVLQNEILPLLYFKKTIDTLLKRIFYENIIYFDVSYLVLKCYTFKTLQMKNFEDWDIISSIPKSC